MRYTINWGWFDNFQYGNHSESYNNLNEATKFFESVSCREFMFKQFDIEHSCATYKDKMKHYEIGADLWDNLTDELIDCARYDWDNYQDDLKAKEQ